MIPDFDSVLPSPELMHQRIDQFTEEEPRLAALYQERIAGRAVEVIETQLRGDSYRPISRDCYHINIGGEECVMFIVKTAKTAKPERGLGPRLRGVALPLKYDKVAVELFEYFQENDTPWENLKYRTYLRRCKTMFEGFQYYIEDYEKAIYRLLEGERRTIKIVNNQGKEVNQTETVQMHLREAGTHIIRHIVIDRLLSEQMDFNSKMLRLYAGHTGNKRDDYGNYTPMQFKYLHMNIRETEGLEEIVVKKLAESAMSYIPNIINYYKNPPRDNQGDVEIIQRLG